MSDTRSSSRWIVFGLLTLGLLARLAPHPPNVTPLTAIALFSGVYLDKRWSLVVPVAIVILSDLLIGWHTTILFTWSAFVLTGCLAWWVRRAPGAGRIMAGAAAGSGLFFLVTNFGVWLVDQMYPPTLAGLWQCYVAALPFLRNMLAGDLVYTTVLFGLAAWTTGPAAGRRFAKT